MEYRRAGKSWLVVSALGFGSMGMSNFYGNPNEQESTATIHHAIDCGITLLDTADVYGVGRNEEAVGRAMEKRRNEVIVATKIAIVRDASNPNQRGLSGRPESVRKCCEQILRRLRISTIDLHYQHRADTKVPVKETASATSLPHSGRQSALPRALPSGGSDHTTRDQLAPRGAAAGDRYNQEMMKPVGA